MLSLLKEAKTWYIDGTFHVIRRPFQQLLSIHAFVKRGGTMKHVPLRMLHTDVTAPQTRLQSCPAAHHQPHTRPPIDGGAVGLRGSSVARCTRCVRGQSDALWLRLPLDTSCLAKDSGVNLICFLIHTMMNCLSTTCYMIVGI